MVTKKCKHVGCKKIMKTISYALWTYLFNSFQILFSELTIEKIRFSNKLQNFVYLRLP